MDSWTTVYEDRATLGERGSTADDDGRVFEGREARGLDP